MTSSPSPVSQTRTRFVENFRTTTYKKTTTQINWDPAKEELSLAWQDNIGQQRPAVAANGNGAFVVWQDLRSDDGDILAQFIDSTGSRRWDQDARINTDGQGTTQLTPAAAMGIDGSLWATWVDNRIGDRQIYLQRVDSAGKTLWLSDLQVSSTITGTEQGAPSVAPLANGSVLVAWHDNRTGDYDLYAQLIDSNGQRLWANDLRINSDNSQQSQTDPAIVTTSSGNLLFAWLDRRTGSGDIYLQRVNATGTRVWSTEIRVNTPASTSQRPPVITSHGSDGAVIAWTGEDGVVYGQRVDQFGRGQWPENQPLISLDQLAATDASPALQSIEDGTVIVVWKRADDGQLISQAISASGTRTGSSQLLSAEGINLAPTFQLPGMGRLNDYFLVAWPDKRLDDKGDIFAQLMTAEGTPKWSEDVQLSDALGSVDQAAPSTVSLADSTVVVWRDQRREGSGLYAQQIAANGETLWADGLPLFAYTLSAQDQPTPDLATDGETITAVWSDAHSGQSHIYLQKFDQQGRFMLVEPLLIQRQSQVDTPQFNPKVSVDKQGQIYLVWEEETGNPNGNDYIIVAQKRDANWQVLSEDIIGNGRFPNIAVNDSGQIQIVWLSIAGSDVELYSKALYNDFLDTGFLRPTQVNHLDGLVDRFAPPALALDASGTAHIAWVDRSASGVYLQRLLSGTMPQWPESLLLNETPGTFSAAPSVSVDQQGQSVVAWQDFYQGEYTIVAQRVDVGGERLWQGQLFENIVVSFNGIDVQRPIVSMNSVSGIASIVWQDTRKMNDDVYLQRLSASGETFFPEELWLPNEDRFYQNQGTAESKQLNVDGGLVRSATVTADYDRGGGMVVFQLTNNGGLDWQTVSLGTRYLFDTAGSDLRWRTILKADPNQPKRTPIIRRLVIEYDDEIVTEDGYEDNDHCENARPIQIDGPTQNHLLMVDANTALLDQDWVKFDASLGQQMTIHFRASDAEPRAIMRLYANCTASVPLAVATAQTLGLQLSWVSSEAATYYLHISSNEENMPETSAYQLSISSTAPSGLAVIAVGPLAGLQGGRNYSRAAGARAYRAMINRGYTAEQITYLDANPTGTDTTRDVDGVLTKATLLAALEPWTREPESIERDLLLYLVGDGGRGGDGAGHMKLANGELLDQATLDLWLSNLSARSSIEQVAVILEMNQAGAFIKDGVGSLSASNRILIASTNSSGVALPSPKGFLFSDSFWLAFNDGFSLHESFQIAKQSIQLVNYRCQPTGEACQQPSYDDNGNGIANDGTDGELGESVWGIPAVATSPSPQILQITTTATNQGKSMLIKALLANSMAETQVVAHLVPSDILYQFAEGITPEPSHPKIALTQQWNQKGDTTLLARTTFSAHYPATIDLENTKIIFYAWGDEQMASQPYVYALIPNSRATKIFIPYLANR